MSEPKDQTEAACGGSALTAELDAKWRVTDEAQYQLGKREAIAVISGEMSLAQVTVCVHCNSYRIGWHDVSMITRRAANG